MAKRWPDEQEAHMRQACWISRQLTMKSNTHTESMNVNATGISVNVIVSYPGRSRFMPERVTSKLTE